MTTDPKPNESPSEYFDRMLGEPGSLERKLAGDHNYRYYLKLWDAVNKNPNPRECNERLYRDGRNARTDREGAARGGEGNG